MMNEPPLKRVTQPMLKGVDSENFMFERKSLFIQLLKELNTATSGTLSLREVLDFTLEQICKYTDWNIGHAWWVDPELDSQLVSMNIWWVENPEAYLEFRKASEGMRISIGVGLPGKVFEQKKPVWFHKVSEMKGFLRSREAENCHIKMGLAVPILVSTRVAGVIEFFSADSIILDDDLLDVMAHIGALVGRVVEKKEALDALQSSEGRFRSIFENTPHGIILLSLEGKLLEWNQAVRINLGYEHIELQQLIEILHQQLLLDPHMTLHFEELRKGERETYQLEKLIPRKDGSKIWGSITVSLVKEADNRPQSVLVVLEDITHQKEMERELSELQRRRLESRELERKRLAKELHDGPLQDLYGVAYQLQLISDNLKDKNDSHSIGEAQKNINAIIRKLRGISGELRPPTLAPFGLEKAIRSHAESQQEEHPELNIELYMDHDQQALPEPLRLALFRIYQQAFQNTLTHSFANRVQVTFQIDDETVVLEIMDDGIGFDATRRRIDMAREGRLGLIGAAERAEALGGSFTVESKPGKGTTVRVVIPISSTLDNSDLMQ
jgi:PAS domain S-box-containing protein